MPLLWILLAGAEQMPFCKDGWGTGRPLRLRDWRKIHVNPNLWEIKNHLKNQTRIKINQIKLLLNQIWLFQESKDKKKIKTNTFYHWYSSNTVTRASKTWIRTLILLSIIFVLYSQCSTSSGSTATSYFDYFDHFISRMRNPSRVYSKALAHGRVNEFWFILTLVQFNPSL